MKYIINKRTGRKIDNPYEARALVKNVKRIFSLVQADDHLAPHGRSSPMIAERSDLPAIMDSHSRYICVYAGSEDCGFSGTKALFIGFRELPDLFKKYFPHYDIVEE